MPDMLIQLQAIIQDRQQHPKPGSYTNRLLDEGILVPTLNLEEVDERCAMINHVTAGREQPLRIAAVQNFAFGGVNTNILIKKWEGS